jgi:hypothetical protein
MMTHFTVIRWADHRTKHSFYKLATPEPATALLRNKYETLAV